MKVVDKCLVHVFTVSLKDVLAVEKSLGHRQQAIGEEDDDKAQVTDVLAVVGDGRIVACEQKHHRQTHDNASHVARETAGIGAEVEKGKDEQGNEQRGKEFYVDKVLDG